MPVALAAAAAGARALMGVIGGGLVSRGAALGLLRWAAALVGLNIAWSFVSSGGATDTGKAAAKIPQAAAKVDGYILGAAAIGIAIYVATR